MTTPCRGRRNDKVIAWSPPLSSRHHDAVHAHLGLPSAVGAPKIFLISLDVLRCAGNHPKLPEFRRSYDIIP